MAELPIELWHLIFDHFENLADLSSCALVCKAVYLAVKEYRVREVAFTRRVYKWFHDTPISNHKHRADFTMASILKWCPFNFDYLKRLKIGRYSSIDLSEINRFVNLEELDIDLKNYEKKNSRVMSLANLKVLYLFMSDHLPYLELDTPRLAKVCTFSLKRLEFVYPDAIRCIHTFSHDGKLSMFRNLEYLTFTDCYNQNEFLSSYYSKNFNDFSITNLKKLKEIDFFYHSRYEEKNLNDFKEVTANILELDRPNLKLFWFNVRMTDTDLLKEYQNVMMNCGSFVAFHLLNYEKLKDKRVEFFWWYSFNESMSLLQKARFNLRSKEFISKLLSTYSFGTINLIGRVVKRELLLELIASSPSLFRLQFENSGLDQSFFDQMTDTVRLNAIPLARLRVKGSSNGDLNFEFVCRLRHLELLETDHELSNELIAKLLQSPMLAQIKLYSGQLINRIERISASRFRLNEKPLSLQKLLEHFEAKPDWSLHKVTGWMTFFGLG